MDFFFVVVVVEDWFGEFFRGCFLSDYVVFFRVGCDGGEVEENVM